jgi:hypothetical protein
MGGIIKPLLSMVLHISFGLNNRLEQGIWLKKCAVKSGTKIPLLVI